jgi:hypothetical protein
VTDDDERSEVLAALSGAAERLDQALSQVPRDTGRLLHAIGEGVALLLAVEVTRLAPDDQQPNDPRQTLLFPDPQD